MPRAIRNPVLLAGIVPILFVAVGCRSAHVEATVVNSGNTPIHNVEVDYPSGSFGISNLASGAAVHHKLKFDDAGRMKVEFFDADHKKHSGTGPYTADGQSGVITLTLDGTGKNTWTTHLQPTVQAPKGE